MQHIIRNTLIVVVILAICGISIFPPSAKLRRGRDLAGGVTLVYNVNLAPEDDPARTIDSMIEVLKQRVDPNGLFEISFVRQGRNRIEISMPLPTDSVKALRDQFQELLESLEANAIDRGELEAAMSLPAAERSAAIERLAAGDDARLALMRTAAERYDAAQEARKAYQTVSSATIPSDEEMNKALEAASQAQFDYERALDAVIRSNITRAEIEQALALSAEKHRIKDTETGKVDVLPSPQERAIERIRQSHPESQAQIDRILAAYGEYAQNRRSLDDPADLKRLLRGSGVLNFRIVARPEDNVPDLQRLRRELIEQGPRGVRADGFKWLPIHDIASWYDTKQQFDFLQSSPEMYFAQRGLIGEERDGVYYLLTFDSPGMKMTEADGDWAVTDAFPSVDEMGRPSIAFRMDAKGASLLGALTGANLQRPMAVILDDRIYTAPTLIGRISSNGQIVGNFPQAEIDYIKRTLAAGSLQARLDPEPISEDVLGPELGADNLRSGLRAGVISFIIVAVFMCCYYFTAGFISVIALFCNAVVILGLMSLSRAAFTLPGIAGVILTFGMAVDANVLIYERVREEILAGSDLRTAVRLGFQRVLSTILDANITTLIACIVLYYTATPELKGFAVVMGIGIVGTLFSALLMTRLIFVLLVDKLRIKKMSQLPIAVPFIDRLLTPRVNWLRLRPIFWTISSIFVAFSLFAIFTQGEKMLDNEFRGGTAVTVNLSHDPDGMEGPQRAEPISKTRAEVEERLRAITLAAEPGTTASLMRTAEILPIDPEADGVTSDRFKIKTIAQERDEVANVVTTALAEWLEVRPPVQFAGMDIEDVAQAPVVRILDPVLGKVLGRPALTDDVSEFVGGVAVVLQNITPPRPEAALRARLDAMRESAGFADTVDHRMRLLVTDRREGLVTGAVVVATDPSVDAFATDEVWRAEVAAPEWRLVREAMQTSASLAGVQSFSAQIAQTFKAQATVAVLLTLGAIMMYIWVRFGSVRYSLAAVLSLGHDILATVAFIAIAEIIYDSAQPVATALLIEPFKIDLALIAALLTIVGYSLNDTIVIMDRVRENRGRLGYASADVVNTSINQTMSRTIITTGTTLLAVFILYVEGGQGVRAFAYALLIGVFSGSYSTVAIAAPLLYSRKAEEKLHAQPRPRAGAGAKEALVAP